MFGAYFSNLVLVYAIILAAILLILLAGAIAINRRRASQELVRKVEENVSEFLLEEEVAPEVAQRIVAIKRMYDSGLITRKDYEQQLKRLTKK